MLTDIKTIIIIKLLYLTDASCGGWNGLCIPLVLGSLESSDSLNYITQFRNHIFMPGTVLDT